MVNWGCDETGRHMGLKIPRRKPCGFNSHQPYFKIMKHIRNVHVDNGRLYINIDGLEYIVATKIIYKINNSYLILFNYMLKPPLERSFLFKVL